MSTSAPPAPPSGEQHEIGHGRQQAVITEVGATLRSFEVDGRCVVDGFGVDERCASGRGQVLAPWPNRLGDGRYRFEGVDGAAALDEPERRNAIHGLVRWLPWRLFGRVQNLATLGCVLHPQPGYPWRLSLTVEYRLGREGLTVTTEATNDSATVAPFGLGFHPYLTVGTPTVDTARLLAPARTRLVADDRGLPTGEAEVGGTELDFSAGRPIGPTQLDTAFTALVRGPDGLARVELDHPDGEVGVSLWVDAAFTHLMLYTGDTLDDPSRRRRAIAVEPMTCAPNALRTGEGLVRLEPGAIWRGAWGIASR